AAGAGRRGARRAAPAALRHRTAAQVLDQELRGDRVVGRLRRAARIDQHQPDRNRGRQAGRTVPGPRFPPGAGRRIQPRNERALRIGARLHHAALQADRARRFRILA
nr:hypothetical protein [Tanacetum cinerariifolium]